MHFKNSHTTIRSSSIWPPIAAIFVTIVQTTGNDHRVAAGIRTTAIISSIDFMSSGEPPSERKQEIEEELAPAAYQL